MSIHSQKFRRLLRIMLSILQAIIDVAVCFGCLKIGRVLVPEAEIFIAGTMFIFFLFSPLYGFKNWTFRDEAKSCFIAVLYSLLLSLFFTYSVGYPVTNTAVGLAMFFPAVIAVRYLFRQMLTASGILNVKFLTFNSGGAREFFTKKINASPFKLRKIRRQPTALFFFSRCGFIWIFFFKCYVFKV